MVTPVIYRVVAVPHVVDGDTLWVQREWTVGDMEGVELLGRDYLGGRKVRLHDGDGGLNTPEVNKVATREAGLRARVDLEDWLHSGPVTDLELVPHGIDSFGRLLGNLQVIGHPESSAVSYMLSRGWESYK